MAVSIVSLFLTSLILRVKAQQNESPIPIVLWHGMGDNCCHSFSMGAIKNMLEEAIPGVYVHSLMIGQSPNEDTLNGFFKGVDQQISIACDLIKNDKKLGLGYNAIGFSQGGQFLRAVSQICPQGMQTLISFGGQHQGVYGLPDCNAAHIICDYIRRLLNYGAYSSWVQNKLVQAQYWHDPLAEDEYRKKSLFMADINNDRDLKNSTYKENLLKLQKLVLIKFAQDSVVVPRESEWFGFYQTGQTEKMLSFNETKLYMEDWIGLKTLDQTGRLDFLSSPGDHLQFTDDFFRMIVDKYLK